MIDTNSNSEKVVTQLPTSGDLTYLSKQGVLLLNRALTVRQAKPNSHSKIWHTFTKEIIEQLFYITRVYPHPVPWAGHGLLWPAMWTGCGYHLRCYL